jgi:hypothetical protein
VYVDHPRESRIKTEGATFNHMPTQGDKWRPTGGFNERPPRFSWWGAGTLIGMAALIVAMALINSC